MPASKKRFVVVTTEHRGVFGGVLEEYDPQSKTAVVADAQMCVYWSADVRGVMGLASSGPSKSCKVTPPAPRAVLQGVTAVFDATDDAAKAWSERPWR